MKEALPWRVRVVVVAGASLFAAGGVIALMRPELLASPHGEINSVTHVYAGYMFSRNLPLAVMLVAALITDARQALSGLMALAALIQLVDAGVDAAEDRIILIPGIVILGTLFSLAAARLSEGLFRKATLGPSLAEGWYRPKAPILTAGTTASLSHVSEARADDTLSGCGGGRP